MLPTHAKRRCELERMAGEGILSRPRPIAIAMVALVLGSFSLPYDGVNEREKGGGNQMNRPPATNRAIFHAKLRFPARYVTEHARRVGAAR
jgi:hypothetical protein